MPTCTTICEGLEQVQFDFPNADNGGGGFARIGYFVDGDLIGVSKGSTLYVSMDGDDLSNYLNNCSNQSEIQPAWEALVERHEIAILVSFVRLRATLIPAYWEGIDVDEDQT